MAQQIINLGTLADGSDGDTNKVAWGKAKDNFAELYGRIVGKGYISGLQMKWVSGTALTLTSGAAYIEGTGSVLSVDSDIAKTGLALTASTWYHAYVYDNAGTPDFVLSTTAPATAYNGTARSMTGDTSKRYAGSVKTDASGNVYAFRHHPNGVVRYLSSINGSDFFVLNAGAATTPADVSLATCVPITSRSSYAICTNDNATIAVVIGTSDMGYTLTASVWPMLVNPSQEVYCELPLNSSQQIKYMYRASASASLAIRVTGYTFER